MMIGKSITTRSAVYEVAGILPSVDLSKITEDRVNYVVWQSSEGEMFADLLPITEDMGDLNVISSIHVTLKSRRDGIEDVVLYRKTGPHEYSFNFLGRKRSDFVKMLGLKHD